MSKIRSFVFMSGVVAMTAAIATFAGPAWAAPAEAEVQGLYEGAGKEPGCEFMIEARVVAQGNGTYKVLVRRLLGGDKIARLELAAKTAGGTVILEGKDGDVVWKGAYANGAIRGEFGTLGTFEAKRAEKKSPTLGKKPPAGAVALLEGKELPEMVRAKGSPWYLGDMSMEGWTVWEAPLVTISPKEPTEWPSPDKPLPKNWTLSQERRRADTVIGVGEDGSICIPRGGMSSKRQFEGSFDLHVEFLNPFQPTAHSQGRGNSGVYLPNGQEIQVLDSFGETTYLGGGCGGLYGYKDPDPMEVIESLKDRPECKFTLASLPPLTWQTYDVEYRVETQGGKYVGPPSLTVYHNGIKIHDNVPLRSDARKGGFQFQDHGNPVRYRNIWVLPVASKPRAEPAPPKPQEKQPVKPGVKEPRKQPAKPAAQGPGKQPAKPAAQEPEKQPAKPAARRPGNQVEKKPVKEKAQP